MLFFFFFPSIWHSTRAPSEEGKGQEGARETLSLFITWERILMLKEGFGILCGETLIGK